MKMRNVVWSAAAAALLIVAGSVPARAEDGQAVAAMRLAFQRESSARQMYLAFAGKADDERCLPAAALFRALATAESVHADNHAIVLEHLGVTPRAVVEPVQVGTTAANLRAAIAAEEFERRVAYPRFMDYAAGECLYDAFASLRYSCDAASTHVIRLSLALARLESAGAPGAGTVAAAAPESPRVSYHVCLGCGRVCTAVPAGHCACGTASTNCAVFEATAPARMPALVAGRY